MGRFDPEHRAARAAEQTADAQRRQAVATRHLADAETRQAQALERIADALEGLIEIMTTPPKVTVGEPAKASAPQMTTTPAQQFYPPQDDDTDEVEPLGDEDPDDSR